MSRQTLVGISRLVEKGILELVEAEGNGLRPPEGWDHRDPRPVRGGPPLSPPRGRVHIPDAPNRHGADEPGDAAEDRAGIDSRVWRLIHGHWRWRRGADSRGRWVDGTALEWGVAASADPQAAPTARHRRRRACWHALRPSNRHRPHLPPIDERGIGLRREEHACERTILYEVGCPMLRGHGHETASVRR